MYISYVKILNMTPSAFLVLFVIFYQSEGIDINDINEAYKAKVSSFGLVPPLDNQKGLVEEISGISDRGGKWCDSVNSRHQCKSWEVCTTGAVGRWVGNGYVHLAKLNCM